MEDKIAGWTGGGWRFLQPRAGMALWHVAGGYRIRHDGSNWIAGIETAVALEIAGDQVVGGRQPAIPDPAGGTIIDSEARTALAAALAAMRTHGLIAP